MMVARRLARRMKKIEFVFVGPNEDLPWGGEEGVVLLDTVAGIEKIEVLDEGDLETIELSPRNSVHDFDLGFQLKYLKKLGVLGKVKVIGLPAKGEVNYRRVSSILRKLVAQDMQGS